LPSKENRNWGSKLHLFDLIEKSKIAAGFPKEKVGNKDIPLLVAVIAPEKVLILDASCEKTNVAKNNPIRTAAIRSFEFLICDIKQTT
jgi:hypothetical protein